MTDRDIFMAKIRAADDSQFGWQYDALDAIRQDSYARGYLEAKIEAIEDRGKLEKLDLLPFGDYKIWDK